jgi:cell division septum initiation protein DivIVA
MRVERLVIEAGDNTLTLDLHPRLTVVAGMGRVEREGLVGELIGALGGSRPGLHLELEERSGRHLAVFRPTSGRHRIVDVDRARDVTAEFADAEGSCNLLAHLGLDSRGARRTMRFGAADLATSSNRGKAVEVLAALDQRRVWAAAEALRAAEGDLTSEAEAIGSAPEDAAMIDEVEARHIAVEQAADQFETTRKRTFWIGGACGLATVPGVAAAGAEGLLFAVVAIASVAASLLARARVGRAAKAEEEALSEAGATSYLGFQLQRVNGLLANDTSRKTLMDVAGARRQALAEWQQLAGDIPVEWALANREEIREAARLRREVDALGAISSSAPEVPSDLTGELAHVLVTRLAEVRAVGGEGMPLLLDDPFQQLDPSVKPLLLELLGRSAGEPQIVFLTEDEDVASWARLEALTGEVALIEPAPEHDDSHLADEHIRL